MILRNKQCNHGANSIFVTADCFQSSQTESPMSSQTRVSETPSPCMGSQPYFDSEASVPLATLPTDDIVDPTGPFEDPIVAIPADRVGMVLPPPPPRRRRRALRWMLLLLLLMIVLLGLLYWEGKTSYLQSRWLPGYARQMQFTLEEGRSDAVLYPLKGPFDQRLGYVRLPSVLDKLLANGYIIERQARMSPEMLRYVESSLYPPYREKTQAGLAIIDSQQQVMYDFRYPRQTYARFEDIPNLMVRSLLYIEDRKLLDSATPRRNPTVNWGRFIKAALFKVGDVINLDTPSMGGSTLATQIEKFRHSENGVTGSAEEKLRQMVSASVRVYQNGVDTMPARRQLVLDYLNTVPLSAAPGFGEVNGISDGLFVWFGADINEVNRLLQLKDARGVELNRQGLALRQTMALMIAHRRPSYYLVQNREDLAQLIDSHLRLLGRKGVISSRLMEAALGQALFFRNFRQNPAVVPAETNKGVNMVRSRLSTLLDVSLYDLDRLDLSVNSTLQKDLQDQVTAHLRSLQDPAVAQQNGLVGEYLLRPGQSRDLRYSFTLFERTPEGNRVRVQTDNTDIPFDINEGSKLELGSTAKLRVLATYLEVIAELHEQHSGQTREVIREQLQADTDVLTRWVLEQLQANPALTLDELLAAALDRRYSASPAEVFYTGGGAHTFNNFKREDNIRIPTVRESLQESINLPFVRMLREIVSYITHQQWSDLDAVRRDDNDPRRREVLARFVDREGTQFLARFWTKYAGKTTAEREETFLSGLKLTPVRAAVIHRALYPAASVEDFVAFMQREMAHQPMERKALERLYERYGPDRYNLQDQGYLARVHPLELWLVGYLFQNEKATFSMALAESVDERQQVYGWLLRTKAKNARDSRVRTMLEVEAFTELHRRWRQLGFPFEHLVPSLATALGSSGDRPAALAEFMGIIMNGGERMPAQRITRLAFAEYTPYETHVVLPPSKAEVVMNPAVAYALKNALAEVVTNGTARRLQGAFKRPDGSALNMGGKTGTGDNRLVVTSGGQKVKSRALSRTATLVFYLGDHHFGTLTAFVPGDAAKDFRFTSALPAQVLKGMAPILEPHLQQAALREEHFPTEYFHDGVPAVVDVPAGPDAVEAAADPAPPLQSVAPVQAAVEPAR